MALSRVEKEACLSNAVKIAEAYAKGGGGIQPDDVLEAVYNKLKDLHEDALSE